MSLVGLLFYLARCFPQLFEGFYFLKNIVHTCNISFVNWPTCKLCLLEMVLHRYNHMKIPTFKKFLSTKVVISQGCFVFYMDIFDLA